MVRCADPELQKTLDTVAIIVRWAKFLGYDEAAKNLERYLRGLGDLTGRDVRTSDFGPLSAYTANIEGASRKNPIKFDTEWLRSYPAILQAETNVQLMVERELIGVGIYLALQNRQRTEVKNFQIKPYQMRKFVPDDLFFTSGNSGLTAKPGLRLIVSRGPRGIPKVTGSVRFVWHDRYNWDRGWFIPFLTLLVSDNWITASDLAKLKKCGAQEFFVGAEWSMKVDSNWVWSIV